MRIAGGVLIACLLSGCAVRSHPPASAHPAAPALPATLRALHADIDAVLAGPELAHGTWGIVVRSLRTHETLYTLNPQKLLLPASNMKIVTLAAAAARLGWDFTYQTRLVATGPIEGGTLAGDLIVVGSGDPSLGAADGSAERVFSAWAERLKQLGVRTVAGRVIGDDDAFEDETLGFGWSWDDLPDDYAAGVGALQFNENALRVTVAPGPASGTLAVVSVDPAGPALVVANSIWTGPAGSTTALAARRLPGRARLELRGTIAAGSTPTILRVSVDNPTLFFSEALRRALIAHGLDVRGDAVDIDDVPDGTRLPRAVDVATHRSPPLATLAIRLMKASQNQYAETLLKTLGREDAAGAAPATALGGRLAAQKLFEEWGIGAGSLIQRDGSGLSRYDYVTADALATILVHMYDDDQARAPFVASLPVAGRDGTLGNRLKGTAADGNMRAKTGSMTSVRTLSGYVNTGDGEPLAFAILANNFDSPPDVINKATDAIVVKLAEFKR